MLPSTLLALIIVYSILFVVCLVCLTAWVASWIVQDKSSVDDNPESFVWDESVEAYRKVDNDSTVVNDKAIDYDWVDIKQTFINRR